MKSIDVGYDDLKWAWALLVGEKTLHEVIRAELDESERKAGCKS